MFQILSIWINARGILNLQKELPKVIYEGSRAGLLRLLEISGVQGDRKLRF